MKRIKKHRFPTLRQYRRFRIRPILGGMVIEYPFQYLSYRKFPWGKARMPRWQGILTGGAATCFLSIVILSLRFDLTPLELSFSALLWTWTALHVVYAVWGREAIRLFHDRITLGKSVFGIPFRHRQYPLSSIQNFQPVAIPYPRHGYVSFEYGSRRIECGEHLQRRDAPAITNIITDILTSHCHTVERIIFGDTGHDPCDSSSCLQNPVVSTLNVPFVHLKQLIVQTETANFFLIEQFLIYAINVIGQPYLRTDVTVYIQGDATTLPRHLRNTLTNLCKHVMINQTSEATADTNAVNL